MQAAVTLGRLPIKMSYVVARQNCLATVTGYHQGTDTSN